MATLNQIVDEISDALSRPFDTLFKERLKLLVRHERSKMIRQSINKDGGDKLFRQRYGITVTPVDATDSLFPTGGSALRSVNKLAKPIRHNTDIPFSYVGSLDGRNSYIYTELSELHYVGHLPNNAKAIRYTYNNGYIYLHVNNDETRTRTITAFADYTATVAGTVQVTSYWHEFSTGDYVTIVGTTSYNGSFSVTKIDSNNFYITDTWVADDATGTVKLYEVDDFGLYGQSCDITDYSSTVGGTVKATYIKHGLSTGNLITIDDTTDYDDTYRITVIDEDTFYFTDTYVSDQSGDFYKSKVLVQANYENFELVIPGETADTVSAGIHYTDDMEFPISEDLIQDIKARLLDGELSIIDDKDKIKPTHVDNE